MSFNLERFLLAASMFAWGMAFACSLGQHRTAREMRPWHIGADVAALVGLAAWTLHGYGWFG